MSADLFIEQQRNKSQRKRALERRKRERRTDREFAVSFKEKRRNRHEVRNVLKQWEFLEDESELLYDH